MALPAPRGGRPGAWRLLASNRLGAIGLLMLAALLGLALLTPWLPLADPNLTEPVDRLHRPLSEGYLLGTDHLGRDLLARVLWGTRTSIAVGLSATLIAALFGSLIGLVAGYAGGRTDDLLMRGIDMLMSFPYTLLALAIVAVLGPGLINALYAIAIVNIPFFARSIRGVALGLARRELVDAARLSGKGHVAILLTEVLPNALPVVVITMSTTLGWMILETAGLSFLGLGAQPPQADLGSMLGEGRKLLFTTPHVSLVPGVVVFALVMSVNLLGDGVRDLLDPRLKSGALTRPAARTRIDLTGSAPPVEPSSDTALAVTGLRTEFRLGDAIFKAVDGVGFELRRGECLGLVGESGCGKSVTALSLTGLVPTPPGRIVGGAVRFAGEDLLQVSDERIRGLRGGRIAHVFQDPLSSLHPLYTVGDQLIEALRAHQPVSYKAARARSIELLDSVRIANPAGRMRSYPHELSGGMRQRVSIAMALGNDAEVLIADEPTTALDVTVQAQVLALLDDLRRQRNAAVLFITHDFGVVSEICDRVSVMYAGRMVETGPTAAVLARPAHPYTRLLIDCVPVMGEPERRLEAIAGAPPALDRLPPGCAFAERCGSVRDDCRRGRIEMTGIGSERQVRCRHPIGGNP